MMIPHFCMSTTTNLPQSILWAFIVFNIFAALGHYYLARVPKSTMIKGMPEKKAVEHGAVTDGEKTDVGNRNEGVVTEVGVAS